jgi:hypothetical protein
MSRKMGTRPNRKSQWTADIPPKTPEELPMWLFSQLNNLSTTLFNINALKLDRTFEWRIDPSTGKIRTHHRDGDIILAGEGLIEEGSAPGLYYHDVDTWVKIDQTSLRLSRQYELPDTPMDGDVYLFNQGVAGAKSGIYYYKDYDDPAAHIDVGQWWFLTAEDPV